MDSAVAELESAVGELYGTVSACASENANLSAAYAEQESIAHDLAAELDNERDIAWAKAHMRQTADEMAWKYGGGPVGPGAAAWTSPGRVGPRGIAFRAYVGWTC